MEILRNNVVQKELRFTENTIDRQAKINVVQISYENQ